MSKKNTPASAPEIKSIELSPKLESFLRTFGGRVVFPGASEGELNVDAKRAFAVCYEAADEDAVTAMGLLRQLLEGVEEWNELQRGQGNTPFPAP